MPKSKKIKYLRADSASYQAKIIIFWEEEGIMFAMDGDLDEVLLEAINKIPQNKWKEYKKGHIAETVLGIEWMPYGQFEANAVFFKNGL